jgi:hypothetical protein
MVGFGGVQKLVELGWPAVAGIVVIFVIAGLGRGRGGRRRPPRIDGDTAAPERRPRPDGRPRRPRR